MGESKIVTVNCAVDSNKGMAGNIRPVEPVMPSKELYMKEISSIWDEGVMTNNGEKVRKLKNMLSSYLHFNNIELFVNGHSALLLAIRSLQLNGEVITSPFTFVSTTNAIVQNGLVPVFADIDNSYNLDADKIEELITPKTCAIITPHIFGIPCDIDKIGKIARKYNLKVIYDGAQAFGTMVQGKPIGLFGDITMFSFHAIKIFNTIEGGMLMYQQDSLQRVFELYRNFGISYHELGNDTECIGINAKMNEFQAAMGIVNLSGLENEIQKRKELTDIYCQGLKDIPGIQTYDYKDGIRYNYAYFPVKVWKEYGITRDELWRKLKDMGIGTRKLYDKLTCDFQCYKDCGYIRKTDYADQIKQAALDLPIYGTMDKKDAEYICDAIRKLSK